MDLPAYFLPGNPHLRSAGVTGMNLHTQLYIVLGIEPRASCKLGKPSSNLAASLPSPSFCLHQRRVFIGNDSLVSRTHLKDYSWGQGCSSPVQHLPGVYEALNSIVYSERGPNWKRVCDLAPKYTLVHGENSWSLSITLTNPEEQVNQESLTKTTVWSWSFSWLSWSWIRRCKFSRNLPLSQHRVFSATTVCLPASHNRDMGLHFCIPSP